MKWNFQGFINLYLQKTLLCLSMYCIKFIIIIHSYKEGSFFVTIVIKLMHAVLYRNKMFWDIWIIFCQYHRNITKRFLRLTFGHHRAKSVKIRSLFWSVFSCVWAEYRKIRTRKNCVFGLVSCRTRVKLYCGKMKNTISNFSIWRLRRKANKKLKLKETCT